MTMNNELNLSRVLLDQIKDIDARDESQIMAELAGETVQEMFYVTEIFDRKLKRMVPKPKLSWSGTKEAARSRGNIVVSDQPIINDVEDGVRIVVRVTDLARNFTIFGGCHQPKKQKVNDKVGFHYEDDPYYFTKGLSKAQRNAFQTILPADFIAKCLNKFMALSTRAALKQPAEPGAESAPPKPVPGPSHSTKKETKTQETWDSIAEDMVPDFNALERIFWDITKIQPAKMYPLLGVKNRLELHITAWEAFKQLKEKAEALSHPPLTGHRSE